MVRVSHLMAISILLAGLCRAADAQQLQVVWQSILSSKNDSSIPQLKELEAIIQKHYESITPHGRRILIPVALRCALSPSLKVRESGMILGPKTRPQKVLTKMH